MFYFIPDSAGNLCSPYHRARCCDPEVHLQCSEIRINPLIKSLHHCHWLLQGGNARYRLRAIYKTDEGCPPSVYKCTRPRTGRNLVWTKEETDTFKGYAIIIIMPIFSICIFEAKNAHVLYIHDVGCPVVGKSCSLSSSDPEESNILGVETAHTYGECAGTDTNYFSHIS